METSTPTRCSHTTQQLMNLARAKYLLIKREGYRAEVAHSYKWACTQLEKRGIKVEEVTTIAFIGGD
jgi:hypothetical protein